MAEIVGGVLGAGLTVTRNEVFVVSWLSLAVSVILVVPVCPAAGVIVTVRLDPLPPKRIFAFGTSTKLVEAPITVRLLATVSASPTVNVRGPTGVPAIMF